MVGRTGHKSTNWLRSIEQIMLSSTRDRRIVGLTAPHPVAGVSTVSSAFAEMSARWGSKSLLVDLSTFITKGSDERRWAPGLGDPRHFLETSERRYDVLHAVPTSATRGTPNSVRHFRTSLEDLIEYDAIVLDLPSILGFSLDAINPLVPALACDGVIVVCVKGRTTSQELKETIDALTVAGARIVGTVLNDFG